MGYKINPPSTDELRQRAYERLGMSSVPDVQSLSGEQAKRLLEEVAISKVEVEIQNEYLQETWARLELALSEAKDMYDFAPIGCISTDPDGTITRLNLTAASMLGQERSLLMDRNFVDFFQLQEHAALQTLLHKAELSSEDQRGDFSLDTTKAVLKYVQVFVSPLPWGKGHHLVLTNMTDQKDLEESLRASEERWKFALDATGDGVWDWDVQSGAVNYSPRLAQLYGVQPDQFGGTMDAWRERVHPEDWSALLGALQKCLVGPEGRFSLEYRGLCHDGSWKWIRCQGAVFGRGEDDKVTRMIGTHADITVRKRMEDALLEMSSIQQAVFESLPHYLAVLDGEGNVLKTNALWNAYSMANGHAHRNGFARTGYADLLDAVTGGVPETKRAALVGIADVLAAKLPSFQLKYSFMAGVEMRWFIMHVMPVRDGRARVVVSHQDVTHMRNSPSDSLALGNYDELTGALSRSNFFRVAEREFARATRYKQPLMALVIDINDFRSINENYGLPGGDAVLRGFVQSTHGVLRESDVIGRIGGDEFAVLLPNTGMEGGGALADRLVEQVGISAVEAAGRSIAYSISAGASCLVRDAAFPDLLKRAQSALLLSRKNGSDRVLIDTAGTPCLW